MKRTRHTPEQIVRKLREADRLLAENTPLAEVMRSLGVSHQTYQRWRSQYAAMRPDDTAPCPKLCVRGIDDAVDVEFRGQFRDVASNDGDLMHYFLPSN